MTEIQLIENWYAEPFTKRTSCEVPGQCGGDCDCGCPYNSLTEVDDLPLITELADMFPNEWLAFITTSVEDDDPVPTHGKLVAHSPDPDEIFDAVNTVLWNQCVYVFFNGDGEAMQASYGATLDEPETSRPQVTDPAAIGMTVPPPIDPVPEKLLDLVYSALDQLYAKPPRFSEAIRRLRISKIRAGFNPLNPLHPVIDTVLDNLEGPTPQAEPAIWGLEECLAELETLYVQQ